MVCIGVLWKDIKVHDILKVEKGEELAADLVLLSTSDPVESVAFVQTANLDGESNLKRRLALGVTRELFASEGPSAIKVRFR